MEPVTSLMGYLDLENYKGTVNKEEDNQDDDNSSLGGEVFCNSCDRCYGEVKKKDPAHKYGIKCFDCYWYEHRGPESDHE